ncbi:MAG: carboxypeptidase regulatory-like domain-containing protein [Anaerolineae bacterium]|nr:carboxypeptidase regulatory-like domain-containing protein [Anaerolineae bacterium]
MSIVHFHVTKVSMLRRILIVLIIGVLWLLAAGKAGGQAEPPDDVAGIPPTVAPQPYTTFQLALAPNLPAGMRGRLLSQLRAQYPGNVTQVSQLGVRVTAPSGAQADLRSLPGVAFVAEINTATATPARIMANGVITGVITEEGSGIPLDGVGACTYRPNPYYYDCQNSDATGVYSISLQAGVYQVAFYPQDLHIAEYYDNIPLTEYDNVTPVTVYDDTVTPNINAELALGVAISGQVTAEATGDPIQNAYILIEGQNNYYASDSSDINGAYSTISGLPQGEYRVSFSASGYAMEYYDDAYLPTQAMLLAVTTTHRLGINAALAAAATISGTVTGDGPLENIYINAYYGDSNQNAGYTLTDSQGRYQIGSLGPIAYKLWFSDNSGEYITEWHLDKANWTEADLITLTAGMTTTIDAQLTKGGVFSGTVTNENGGAPLEDISVTAYDAVSSVYKGSATTDAAGVYQIKRLATGTYKLYFQDDFGRYIGEYYNNKGNFDAADPLTITTSMTVTANAQLAAGGAINGAVTAAGSGTPLENVNVTAYDASSGGYIREANTGPDGIYKLGGLASGTYKLRFRDNLGRYASEYYDNKREFYEADPVAVTDGMTTTINAQLTTGGIIAGVVTAAGSGAPLENIDVTAYDALSGNYANGVATDAAGVYRISGLATGNYKLYFQDNLERYANEYYNHKRNFNTGDPVAVTDGVTTTIDVQLTTGSVFNGVVTAAGSGAPLESIRVRAYDAASGDQIKSTYTDGAGEYRLAGLASGSYKLYFQDTLGRYLNEYYNDKGNLTMADPIVLGAAITQTINAELTVGGRITGRVVDAESGMGIANVSVNASCRNADYPTVYANSDAQGYYTTTSMYTGVYRVRFQPPPPYYSAYYENSYNSDLFTPVVATAGITTTGIDGRLHQGYLITGVVSGPSSLSNVSIGAFYGAKGYSTAQTSAHSDGTYEIGPLMPGPYRVRFLPGSLYAGEWYNDAYQYRNAQVVNITGHTVPNINAHLETGGRITGTVTDADGAPLSGVDVWIHPAGEKAALISTATDSQGYYVTGFGLPSGAYQVEFNAPSGYLTQWYANAAGQNGAMPITVVAEATVPNINAVLARYVSGVITGAVTAADTGLPLNAWVYAYNDNGNSVGNTYANGGVYILEGLPPGAYRIRFSDVTFPYVGAYYHNQPGLQHAERITVTANMTVTHIDQALQRGGGITGTVTGPGGIPGVAVYAYRVGEGDYAAKSTYTGPDGEYSIDGLPAGGYKVRFTPPSPFTRLWYAGADTDSAAEVVTITLNTVTPNINVTLSQGGIITGIVTASDTGAPMPGVRVYVYDQDGSQASEPVYCDADGQYRTLGLPGGSYYLRFDRNNWTFYRSEWYSQTTGMNTAISITVPASGAIPNINTALKHGGSISGWIYDAATGHALIDAYAQTYETSSGSYVGYCYVNNWGYYQINGLDDGDHKVYAYRTDYITQWYSHALSSDAALTVTVTAPDDTPNINFHLKPYKKIYLPLVLRSGS